MLLVFVWITHRLNATFHSQSRERRGWKSEEEEESILHGSEDIMDGFERAGECNSSSTGVMKLRLMKPFFKSVSFSVS